MATYTTNLNLKKPGQQDKIRIADINNNMDDIDAAFGAVGTESMAAQLGAIQDSIAIVATGNAHAAITAGQFVFVKGHDTLATGLYVATSNISQNGTLSSSNLTADTAGGLNALSDQIGNLKAHTTLAYSGAPTTETEITLSDNYTNYLFIEICVSWGGSGAYSGSVILPSWVLGVTDGTVVYLNNNPANNSLTVKAGTAANKVKLVGSNANVRYMIYGVLKIS